MRKFDLIIFGATGFTGRFVVERLAATVCRDRLPTRWAIAVRDVNKMRHYLRQIESATGITNLQRDVTVLEADVRNATSMRKAFEQATLVMNCIGPYSLLGEPVVQACINSSIYIVLSFIVVGKYQTNHYTLSSRITLYGFGWRATVSRIYPTKIQSSGT